MKNLLIRLILKIEKTHLQNSKRMNKILKYLLIAIIHFIFQSLGEAFFIVILMYFGLPYSEMLVGEESLWEVVIAVLGFYVFSKCLYYGWLYLLVFVVVSIYRKYESKISLSILNGVLSISLFIILMAYFYEGSLEAASNILNPLIATVLSSMLILIISKLIDSRKRHA